MTIISRMRTAVGTHEGLSFGTRQERPGIKDFSVSRVSPLHVRPDGGGHSAMRGCFLVASFNPETIPWSPRVTRACCVDFDITAGLPAPRSLPNGC